MRGKPLLVAMLALSLVLVLGACTAASPTKVVGEPTAVTQTDSATSNPTPMPGQAQQNNDEDADVQDELQMLQLNLQDIAQDLTDVRDQVPQLDAQQRDELTDRTADLMQEMGEFMKTAQAAVDEATDQELQTAEPLLRDIDSAVTKMERTVADVTGNNSQNQNQNQNDELTPERLGQRLEDLQQDVRDNSDQFEANELESLLDNLAGITNKLEQVTTELEPAIGRLGEQEREALLQDAEGMRDTTREMRVIAGIPLAVQQVQQYLQDVQQNLMNVLNEVGQLDAQQRQQMTERTADLMQQMGQYMISAQGAVDLLTDEERNQAEPLLRDIEEAITEMEEIVADVIGNTDDQNQAQDQTQNGLDDELTPTQLGQRLVNLQQNVRANAGQLEANELESLLDNNARIVDNVEQLTIDLEPVFNRLGKQQQQAVVDGAEDMRETTLQMRQIAGIDEEPQQENNNDTV